MTFVILAGDRFLFRSESCFFSFDFVLKTGSNGSSLLPHTAGVIFTQFRKKKVAMQK